MSAQRVLLAILTAGYLWTAATPPANAATYYWSGTGHWSDAAWASSSGGPYQYSWSAGYDAAFEGTAGTVTIPSLFDPTANSLAFNVSGYTVTGDSLTLASGSVSVVAGGTATINSVIAGSAGLTKTGAGTLVLSGANTYSGQTTVGPQWSGNGFGTLTVTGSIGAPAATCSVSGGTLSIAGGTVTGSEMDVGIGGTQSAIVQGSGAFNAATLVVGYYTYDYTGFGCTYTLNGGTATISSTLWVGKEYGSGIFTQNGGLVTSKEPLIVGHDGGNGVYILNGGVASIGLTSPRRLGHRVASAPAAEP